jgi:hypothetical protein
MAHFIEADDKERFVVVVEHLEGDDTSSGVLNSEGLCKYLADWANNPNNTTLLRVFPVGKQIGYYNKRYHEKDGETVK